MIKSKRQIALILLGLISYGIGVWTVLQIPTIFVNPLHLVLLYTVLLLAISFGLGLLIKRFLKSKWHILTFTSIFISVCTLIFYISQRRPRYDIVIPDTYAGNEIKLIVSRELTNDFQINNFGVGYINEKTFDQNFIPVAIKSGQNLAISGLTRYSNYSISKPKLTVSLDYIQFKIPGGIENGNESDIETLIEQNGIDTTRIKK